MRTLPIIILALATATPARAQSTVVLPLPGRQWLCGHLAGLYDGGPADAGWGMADRPTGGSGPQHDRPAAPRRWLGRHGTIQCGSCRSEDKRSCTLLTSTMVAILTESQLAPALLYPNPALGKRRIEAAEEKPCPSI